MKHNIRHLFLILSFIICVLCVLVLFTNPTLDDFESAYCELQEREYIHYSCITTMTADSIHNTVYSEYIAVADESVYITSDSESSTELIVLTTQGKQYYTMTNMDSWMSPKSPVSTSQAWMTTPIDSILEKTFSVKRKYNQILFSIEEGENYSEYVIKNGKIIKIKYSTKINTTQNNGIPIELDTITTYTFHDTSANQCTTQISKYKCEAAQ